MRLLQTKQTHLNDLNVETSLYMVSVTLCIMSVEVQNCHTRMQGEICIMVHTS